jgi:peptide/nickel transport system permease protein
VGILLRFILRRLALLVIVLAGISVIAFVLTHLIPGNPARLLAGPHANRAELEAVKREYGLVGSIPSQYLHYVNSLLHGNLGISLTSGRPVSQDLAQFIPATVELALAAILILVLIGIPLGIWSAVKPGGAVDSGSRVLSVLGVAVPAFWLGLIFQILFYRDWHVLPIGGRLAAGMSPPTTITGLYVVDSLLTGNFQTLGSSMVHLILPATCLAIGGLAIVTRMTRVSAINVLESDYVLMAVSKGLPQRRVLMHHVLRNALIPTTTVLGLQIGFILSATVYTEMVFNWPGIGLYAVNAITNLDYPAIMGVTLVFAFIYVVVNLLVDIAYVLLDPRISYAVE